ncbi:hypothetical protein ACHAW5_002586 [Stephanodiscus triporus]|uniref:tRNA-specific adenosine deaminase 1 n=1 Tax=Stephanodiscus triporus TaxID=2934178 RepID=A0ABD3ME44_9STRA
MHRRIAQCALDHYHRTLSSKNGGKPQTGREWTVYAAIVACRHRRRDDDEKVGTPKSEEGDDRCDRCLKDPGGDIEMWVVSCATGSKCTSIRPIVSSLPRPSKNYDCGIRIGQDNSRTHHNSGTNVTRDRGGETPHFLDLDEGSICKCYNGMVLKDSHAETLARRGLMSCLWDEIEHSLQLIRTKSTNDAAVVEEDAKEGCQTLQLLEACNISLDDHGPVSFRLKLGISLHMYISDSPCGDASIYEIRRGCDRQPQNNDTSNVVGDKICDTEINFTGAKIILSAGVQGWHTDRRNGSISSILTCSIVDQNATGDVIKQSTIALGREGTQQLGVLRTKSSRSNMAPDLRSTSMSCSDKLVRWGVFGLQGSLLAMYIPNPIRLSSICVSKDPRSVDGGSYGGQLAALERALSGRLENVLKTKTQTCGSEDLRPPDVAVVDIIYENSKTVSDNRYSEGQTFVKKRSTEACPAPSKKPKVHDAKKVSACGMSINWHQNYRANVNPDERDSNEATEITIGATGLKRGKKAKTPKDVLRSASRLCRFSFLRRCMRCTEIHESLSSSRHADVDVSTKKESIGDSSSPSTEEEVGQVVYMAGGRLRLVRRDDMY